MVIRQSAQIGESWCSTTVAITHSVKNWNNSRTNARRQIGCY